MRIVWLTACLLALGCDQDVQLAEQVGELVVSPRFIDLGVVTIGDHANAEVDLVNARGTLKVLAVEVLNVQGDYFSASGAVGAEVTDTQSSALAITYEPTEAGLHYAEILIRTDEAENNEHIVQVRGLAASGAAHIYPPLIDFGPVPAGSSASAEFTLVNDGVVPVDLNAFRADNPLFVVATSLPLTVQPGESAQIAVRFESDGLEHIATSTPRLSADASADSVVLQANACSNPSGTAYDADLDGHSYCADDCDDADATSHGGATEVCDGRDNNCDGTIDESTSCFDDDGDGISEDEGDCNDSDSAVASGFIEVQGNGIDDDCDGVADFGTGDGDGDGYAAWAGDCDDAEPTLFPGAAEVADGLDNDCDGTIDEGTLAYDDDGDGVSEDAGDCDDTNTSVLPFASELQDGVDNDCDTVVDEGTSAYDDDTDGFTEIGGDCDDANAAISPGIPETTGDGIDNDCDGVVR